MIPKFRAQQLLHDWSVDSKRTYNSVYNTVLQATEDEDQADKAASNFILEAMKTGETPEI